MKTVVGIGEALWDCLPDGRKIGGAPANFAFHASQMGCRGIAVSAIGNDELGDEIVETFKANNLEHLLQRVDKPTGTVIVTVDNRGIPSYEIKRDVAWDNISANDEFDQLAKITDCVCFGSLAQRNQSSRKAIERFLSLMPENSLKVFDINLRQDFFSKEIIETSLNKCNILKINDEEIKIVSEMFGLKGDLPVIARQLLEKFGLKAVILTWGENGSFAFTADEVSYCETPRVKIADTVGAGDSFTAAFCASLLNGLGIKEAHKKAVDVSAFVCTQSGAMPIIPDNLK